MSSAKKKGGLGAESYFETVPKLQREGKTRGEAPSRSQNNEDGDTESRPLQRQKIRRTYALYEETQIALEEMKLAARKEGEKVTLGDLLEEAVQLLIEKRGLNISS
jgi:hypothetical protein